MRRLPLLPARKVQGQEGQEAKAKHNAEEDEKVLRDVDAIGEQQRELLVAGLDAPRAWP